MGTITTRPNSIFLTLAVLMVGVPLGAQTNTGRILGSVVDQTTAVVVDATVTITDVERGAARTLTTNESGEYLATNLLPGVYLVRASAKGLKNVERRNIEL